jgi:hypothetical protein
MSRKFAVLISIEEPRGFPIGVAVDLPDHVLVDVPDHLCIPARHRGEYRVMQPDGSILTYRPGDEGYFGQVLLDLSRVFAIGERGEIEDDDPFAISELLAEKVYGPIRETRVGLYAPTYGAGRYLPEERPDAERAGSPMVVA